MMMDHLMGAWAGEEKLQTQGAAFLVFPLTGSLSRFMIGREF
jgi:hypothetical protein